jgi:hypothetical protein
LIALYTLKDCPYEQDVQLAGTAAGMVMKYARRLSINQTTPDATQVSSDRVPFEPK